jgi:hypothetical protein
MSEREELVAKANELGLEFQANIPTKKLQIKIDEANGVVEVSEPVEVVKTAPTQAAPKVLTKRQKIRERKLAAFKTRVVTLTNKDPRDSAVANTAHLSFENSYFGLAKNVPLDIPVELEVSLIKVAAAALMPLHKTEYKDGKATGNMVTTRVKKYAISYGEEA